MKQLILISALVLAGCSTTTPVERHFPAVPAQLKQACPDLKKAPETTKLSEVLTTVTQNYGQYHECHFKVDAWIEWYDTQKKIFDEVK